MCILSLNIKYSQRQTTGSCMGETGER